MDGSGVTNPLNSTSMTSLISRLDRLESTMRYLEGKKEGSKGTRDSAVEVVQREPIPLGLAVKEAQSKGSVLDRVAALEDRLVQLLLDIESEAASPSRSTSEIEQTSPDITSSPRGSMRKGFSQSFSRLRSSISHEHKQVSQAKSQSFSRFRSSISHENKQASQMCIDKFEVEDPKEQQQKRRHIRASVRGKSRKEDEKKVVPSSWLNLRLLGC